ncbi:SDR family NAD(P)-dependent oxidoreductase [Legionella shakespearei]|uniref:Short chain dehydrogenase/reductase family oxidoreductase n=1 Tax=Legionella shakespearei DSM 23087 TaxID=1122169 RepID=A0A0W0YV97_9GAMM|nr:SDR family NAD(P)-dependent oxidoreductase [Legionella shakespearei]KTD60791.1 short chain dehydrogenase/reductase family oxidoreductase [Legionella shakespearei DSM 23087]
MKVAVITGAASGIGLALSLVCLQRDMAVVMVDKDSVKLDNEATRLTAQYPDQILCVPCDVTKPLEIEELLVAVDKKLGRVDWIFNNAGIIGNLAPVWDLKPEHIHQVMDVNLYGMIHMIRVFMPYLIKQDNPAHIINMASLYALCSGSQMAAYSMSKHAVLALSESLHFDIQRMGHRVDVSVVFPSFTDTSLLSKPSEVDATFQNTLNSLLAHSRPAEDVALHVVQEVEHKKFYILPDKEVKGYCEDRTKAILLQENPHVNSIEKLMGSLMKRKRRAS